MKAGDKVRLTKIGKTEGGYPAAKPEEYNYGGFSGFNSVPEGYFTEGFLANDVQVGAKLMMSRIARSNEKGERVEIGGEFISSMITDVNQKEQLFRTLNSLYKVEFLK